MGLQCDIKLSLKMLTNHISANCTIQFKAKRDGENYSSEKKKSWYIDNVKLLIADVKVCNHVTRKTLNTRLLETRFWNT